MSEDMHRVPETEDSESSLILGFGCSLATVEAVSNTLKNQSCV